jgi:MFS family permease
VLTATQVVGGLGVGAGVAVTTLLAFDLSGSAALAGLAASFSAFGAGLFAAVIGAAARFGRRPGLVAGYLVGATGAGVAVLAAVTDLFPLLLVATFLFGASNASNLQSRFAVTDLASPERRGADLSRIVWATTVGAVLGPNLTGPGAAAAAFVGVPELAGPYLLSAASFATAALLMAIGLRPDPLLVARRAAAREVAGDVAPGDVSAAAAPATLVDVAPARRRRSAALSEALAIVVSQPSARAAAATIAAAHAVMVGVMVMTPVHMGHHGADIRLIGLTISLHIAGMYALSPVFGWLVDRLGSHTVLVIGFAQLVGAVAFAAFGTPRGGPEFLLGLFLLGTGWSACLIASSALLTTSVPVDNRAQVQGLSDLGMNVAGGSAGALSGLMMTLIGFRGLASVTLVLLLGPAILVRLAVLDARRSASAEHHNDTLLSNAPAGVSTDVTP